MIVQPMLQINYWQSFPIRHAFMYGTDAQLFKPSTLAKALQLPSTARWQQLHQVHGIIHHIINEASNDRLTGDALITQSKNCMLSVRMADCGAILLYRAGEAPTVDSKTSSQNTKMLNPALSTIAAIHAGWRGTAAGIIGHTLAEIPYNHQPLYAALGPMIRQKSFEVGAEVRTAFLALNPIYAAYFTPSPKLGAHYLFDLSAVIIHELMRHGVDEIIDLGHDSFSEIEFFSARRDAQQSKTRYQRMLAVIALI